VLQDKDRQLVFTAPAPPNTLEGLEERIQSRLAGGLVVTFTEPDRVVRRAVLERNLGKVEVALLDYLADRPATSIRAMLAELQRVKDAADGQSQPLTAGLARVVLEGEAPPRRRTSGFRTSGIVVSSAGGVRSREKMVWEWPVPADRMLEELR